MIKEMIESPVGGLIPVHPYGFVAAPSRRRGKPMNMNGPKKSRCDELLRKF
jgi:hypothetical protein